MKRILIATLISVTTLFSGCQRVAPNTAGVLMENYGKNGKADFSIVSGRVWTVAPGTELYTVPLFEQRATFDKPVILKSADGVEFQISPIYSFKVIRDRSVDVIFDNKQIMGSEDAIQSIRTNILDPKIVDILRSDLLSKKSVELMAEGGNEKFNTQARSLVSNELNKRGFELVSFSAMLDYSDKVKSIIDARNQSNTQASTIDSKIEQAKKELELERINTEIAKVKSEGLTDKILQQQFIDKWDGKSPIYSSTPLTKVIQ